MRILIKIILLSVGLWTVGLALWVGLVHQQSPAPTYLAYRQDKGDNTYFHFHADGRHIADLGQTYYVQPQAERLLFLGNGGVYWTIRRDGRDRRIVPATRERGVMTVSVSPTTPAYWVAQARTPTRLLYYIARLDSPAYHLIQGLPDQSDFVGWSQDAEGHVWAHFKARYATPSPYYAVRGDDFSVSTDVPPPPRAEKAEPPPPIPASLPQGLRFHAWLPPIEKPFQPWGTALSGGLLALVGGVAYNWDKLSQGRNKHV